MNAKSVNALAIPISPESMTAAWLTDALRSTGAIHAAAVEGFESEYIGDGEGVMSQTVRLRLRYGPGEPGAPRTLVAKFPTPAVDRFFVARLLRFYEREAGFYAELQGETPVRTPRCYFQSVDEASGAFVLLLEDLAHGEPGDQVGGCEGRKLELAVDALAALHAAWWGQPRLDAPGWMPPADDRVIATFFREAYAKSWQWLKKNRPGLLTGADRAAGDRLTEAIGPLLGRMAGPPRTLIHGDYRADNLIFVRAPEGPAPVVTDWQTCAAGLGAFDVAYFLSQSVHPEVRRAEEGRLLERYHAALQAQGVEGYGLDDCLDDYRRCVLLGLAYPVIGARTMERMTARGHELALAMIGRSLAAVKDWEALGVEV